MEGEGEEIEGKAEVEVRKAFMTMTFILLKCFHQLYGITSTPGTILPSHTDTHKKHTYS